MPNVFLRILRSFLSPDGGSDAMPEVQWIDSSDHETFWITHDRYPLPPILVHSML